MTTRSKVRAFLAAGAFGAICAVSSPSAAAGFFQNYQVNTDFDVYSIALYQQTANGGGITNSFSVFAPETLITDPFLKLAPITSTYFLGVSDLGVQPTFENDSEVPPEKHLIIAFNETFASGAVGSEFSSLFADYTETSLVDALVLLNTPDLALDDPDRAAQLAAKEAAYGLLFNFSDTVVAQGGAFGSTDTFSMVSFSTGASFGSTGNSFTTEGPAVVPEPGAWALMILGFGAVGGALRRRRESTPFAGA